LNRRKISPKRIKKKKRLNMRPRKRPNIGAIKPSKNIMKPKSR
jgi:hypothetical protein